MAKVWVFTDFDGTATAIPGKKLVFFPKDLGASRGVQEFYQSLLQGYMPGIAQVYHQTPMLTAKEICQKLVDKFGKYDPKVVFDHPDSVLLIRPKAMTYFQYMTKQQNMELAILTKNKQEYVEGLLLYQGLPNEFIQKITIYSLVQKSQVIENHLDRIKQGDHVYVFEDSQADFDSMRTALDPKMDTIKFEGQCCEPGQLDWEGLYKNLLRFPSSKSNLTDSQSLEDHFQLRLS